jgi:hypothetical protein
MGSRASFRIQRRIFLSALGLGLSTAAATRLSRVALAQAEAAPKRFMLFYMPHGAPPEHFQPQVMANDPTTFSLAQSGVSILGPLEEQLKQYVTVVQGLKYPKGAQTHEAIVTCLSGVGTADGMGSPDDGVARVTVEHQIAAGLGVKPLILGAVAHRPFGLDKDGKLMWDGTPVVPEKNPLIAYDAAFANLSAPAPVDTGPNPDVALTESLRALTEAELEGLMQELSALTAEQTKLKTHLEAIRALKAGGGGGGGGVRCDAAPELSAVETLRSAAAGQSDEFFLKEENFPQLLAAQLQIAGAALRCNASPVVAVQPMYANCELDFGFMGSSGAHHSALSHTGPQQDAGGSLNITVRDAFAKAQRWFFEQLLTHTLTALLEPDPADPAHKVIDNTIVYVMSEIGEGAWHPTATQELRLGAEPGTLSYIPSVIIGGGGGALKAGQVVTFAADRPAGDLYLSLCQAMGVTGSFPDASGPITEVLL